MATRAAGVALAAGAVVAGCAGPTSMGGFSERDARVTSAAAAPVDACSVRTGLLVVEVERVVVNEYPHHDPTSAHAQQPLLVRSIFAEGQPESEGDVQAWVSPLRYRVGQEIGSFAAVRVLERPLRALAGKRIVLRLAENDRTNPAGWNHVAQAAGGAAGASGAVGFGVPSALVQEGVHLLAKLDRDDLILLWQIDAGSLVSALGRDAGPGGASGAHALRFALGTPRRAPDGMAPAAMVDVLVFRQPEPGCP
ncbi:MAG TPA: hypothetical protein VFH68_04780 [Polyangia bacterium]|jgi:hypothetical protein|nr:hypothetical protein [Polyangia bacterium]